MQFLDGILKQKFADGDIGFHHKAVTMKITHLAFADDIVIFFDGKADSLKGITLALQEFGDATGLQMNPEKSSLILNEHVLLADKMDMTRCFKTEELPVKYLGLPLLNRRLRKDEFRPLIVAIECRFKNWTNRFLSFAGRLLLIRSVILSTLNFWMTAFILPKSCIDKIVGMCSRFLWGGDITKRAMVKVSWRQICVPKEEGGLGLKDLVQWNITLCHKLVWRLFSSKDSLWVAWCQTNKLAGKNFWTIKQSVADSWIWKLLLNLRPLASQFLKGEVNDGNALRFWSDHWLCGKSPLQVLSSSGPQRLGVPLNLTVKQAIRLWSRKPERARNPQIKEFLLELTSSRKPDASKGEDLWYWNMNCECKTNFSADYTWNQIRETKEKFQWMKAVWYKGYVPKFGFFMWIATLNRLPTKDRLHRWNDQVATLCTLCDEPSESRDHVLLHCNYAVEIWKQILMWLGHPYYIFHNWSALLSWISTKSPGIPSVLKRIAVHSTAYYIWQARNRKMHDNNLEPISKSIKIIDRSVKNYLLVRKSKPKFSLLFQTWIRHH